jgi:predicted nucleic acid-binding protein
LIAVDCNALAYLLLDGEQTPRARALLGCDADWHSEAMLLIEFTNVLATAMHLRGLGMRAATIAMTQAEGIMESGLHAANHHEVLAMAARYRVSAYDARYLVVARDLDTKLVTGDMRLRAAAPKLTQSLAEAIGY